MTLKSTQRAYGRSAQLFHWVSAILILAMIPLGFFMQNVESIAARIYIALLVGHIGGVLFHQFTKSDVMGRMGWKGWKTKRLAD